MSIGFLADLHFGNHRRWGGAKTPGYRAPVNQRAHLIAKVVRAAVRQCQVQDVSDLFVLGDLFDTHDPAPQLVAELADALGVQAPDHPQVRIHCLVGNHDQVTTAPGDHALVALDGYRGITVYDRPTTVYCADGDYAVGLVPFNPTPGDQYLAEILPDMADSVDRAGCHLLGLHLGIRDTDTPPWLQSAHDSVALEALRLLTKYQGIAAGNWHQHKLWTDGVGPQIAQVGALVPTGFDNPGLVGYGSLLTYTNQFRRQVIDGPRWLRVHGLNAARQALDVVDDRASLFPTYVSVRCGIDERDAVIDLMDLAGHTDYEVLADKALAEAAAREAAGVARNANSLGEAVARYVDAMELPDDADRPAIKAKALTYLAGAAE